MKAVCSSSDLRAKLIEDARRIARSSPVLRTMIPSRTSDTGTNSWVDRAVVRVEALSIEVVSMLRHGVARGADRSECVYAGAFGLGRGASRDALLDIETPCELMKLTVGKFGDIKTPLRGIGGFCGAPCDQRFLSVVPEVELRMYKVIKAAFHGENKRAAVHLNKGKCYGQGRDENDQWYREKNRKKAPKEITCASTTDKVDELLECERAKDLILDLDELRYLKLHTCSISALASPYLF